MSHVWLAGMRWLRGSLTKEAFGGPWGHEHPSGNEKTQSRAGPEAGGKPPRPGGRASLWPSLVKAALCHHLVPEASRGLRSLKILGRRSCVP